MSNPIILHLDQVTKQFPRCGEPAIQSLSLQLQQGAILSLLGPSGCGKTTLLRMVAGFEKPTTGTITLNGKVVSTERQSVPPEQRDIGMVFQDYALFPHLSVAENVAFGLKNQKRRSLPAKQLTQRVKDVLGLVNLSSLEHRYPHELSGGQQQRVALARALAPQPSLMLLDEPLSNLDAQVRVRLREEVRQILKMTGVSAIFVTHDQEEALSMSDQVAVLQNGKLEQVGTPEEIYHAPQTQFVAEFVSQANCLPAERRGDVWETEIGAFPALRNLDLHQGIVMIRPEDLQIRPDASGQLRIRDRQFLGREHRYCLISPSGQEFHARTSTEQALDIDSSVSLFVLGDKVRVVPN